METKEIIIDSPLGLILIQESQGKLCMLKFLKIQHVDRPVEPSEFLLDCAGQLKDYFDGHLTSFRFHDKILQPGSPFQQKVWNELARIPFGTTLSYRQLALNLGDEKCIRAAAAANGRNNIAIAIPCHRVIGSDGSLVGYAGELWRKKWLLAHEAKYSGQPIQGFLF